jgi:VanZ family protein
MSARWRWILWVAVLAAWTAGLVLPDPLGRAGPHIHEWSRKYLAAKASHLGMYAALAVATAFLAPRPPRWPLLVLALHAALGEWLQTLVPTRSGSLLDVLIDLAGIGAGVALTWWRWRGKNTPADTINTPARVSNQ